MQNTVNNTATNFSDGVERAFANAAMFLPQFLLFLLILVVGYFVARALGAVVDKVLDRIGFDRMVERGGIKRALASSGYSVSDILGKVVFYTLFLFVLQLAFGVFGPNPISELINNAIMFLPNIIVAIVMVVVAAAIASAVRDIISGALGGLNYGRTLATAVSIGIIVVGVFAALNQLNIAPAIINGLFYAMLAIVAGSMIVAIGGGGIVPMRARWERALNRMDEEVPRVKSELETSAQAASRQQPGGYVS